MNVCFSYPSFIFSVSIKSLSSGAKRKHIMVSRLEDGASSTSGLTQEIDIMDIGSSTPKRKKSKSPLKGVLKVTSLSDDEAPVNEHLNNANVMFSTPVSSLKAPRNQLLKLKSTRFQLPSSEDISRKDNHKSNDCPAYVNVSLSKLVPTEFNLLYIDVEYEY